MKTLTVKGRLSPANRTMLQETLDPNNMKTGFYFLRLIDGEATETLRLVQAAD